MARQTRITAKGCKKRRAAACVRLSRENYRSFTLFG
jgi:hypothetical protein